ncbi:MAG TPA: hypothetical protein VFL67_09830, partial [Mycobacterium sp.]|nr:hypothetical protein [Mycobacterium sp.]
ITNVQSFPVAGIATASPGAGPVTVSINGVGVPVAADGSFTGTAALQEGWQLVDVEATDAFGQTTTLIPQVVLDTVPPDVYFQIQDGWVTTDSFVPICGGSDSNLVSLQATLDGEPFICGSMVSAEGSHTLSVAATDAAGNHSEVMNTFAIDRTPPQISISGVADGVTVVAPVSVQVISADAHPLDTTVILDGEVVGEAFTITQSGPHVLRVDSTDLVFNCSVVELHFTVDPEDLAATIVSPADGTTTSNPIAEIVVAINAGHPISQATANGVQLAPQPDGLYHANVSLVEGVNEVQVVVVDSTCAQLVRVVTVVLSSGATALVAQIASSATAGQPLSLVLRALDGLGNVATSYRGSVHLTSTDSQALLPGDYTFTATDAGEHSFVNGIIFRTAGVQALSATDGTLSASQAGIAVSAGAAAQLILSGIPSPIAAGAPTSFNLAVTDSFANPATNYAGTVSFSCSDPQAVVPAPYTFTHRMPARTSLPARSPSSLPACSRSLRRTARSPDPGRASRSARACPRTRSSWHRPSTGPCRRRSQARLRFSTAARIRSRPEWRPAPSTRSAWWSLRGTVHDRTGAPLPAVVARVLNHPELGQTLSREDGAYDLAVNGGSALTVVLDKPGFLEAQRQVATQWQEYEQVADAVLVPLDPASTLLDFTNTTLTQVLRGTPTVDDMGERQAAVFVPPGTQATLVFADGSTQPASALHIRATEYTVGAGGQKAMPAALPPTSAYTYAVEFTADEAAGAKTIQFSQHVYGYVENFLSFPVGAVVPNGYYDRDLGQWVPQENGRVVQILSVTGDLADVDSDGDGVADDAAKLAALDLSNSERERLAVTYAIGQTLWRMPMTHFTPVDFNGNPVLGPFPGPGPMTPAPQRDLAPETQCKVGGSIIECQSQTLGEEVPLAGTPYALTYRSSRQLGRRSNYRLNITIPHAITVVPPAARVICVAGRTPRCSSTPSGAVPVPVHVYVSVAGQVSVQSSTNPSEADRIYAYEWDGKDAYGRALQGEQPIDVRWCYAYPMIGYMTSSAFGRAFATATGDGSILAMRISNGNLDIE